MRLERVETGHSLPKKLLLGVIGLAMGHRASDVLRVIHYRPELFGRAFSAAVQEALRGASTWTACQRELFAGYVSYRNRCVF